MQFLFARFFAGFFAAFQDLQRKKAIHSKDYNMVKQGYKQTEIGVIPEDWEVVKIASVVDFDNGLAHEGIESEAGDFIVVNSKFISTEGKVIRKVTKQLKPLVKNDICIVMSDIPNGKALAKCYLIEKDNIYTLNQRIGRISSKNENPRFLFYELNRNKYYLSFDSGSGQTNLRKNEVLDCLIPLPPFPEQEAIASALSDADAWIDSLEQLIAKKRLIKQGAMQTLLTPPSHAEPVEAWEVKKLGEVFKLKQGVQCGIENQFLTANDGLKRFIRIVDLTQRNTEERFIKDPGSEHHISKNDLFMVRYGAPGIVGYGYNGVIANNLFRLIPKFQLNELYFKYVFDYMRSYLEEISSSSTMAALNFTTLNNIDLFFPKSLSEQERIARILSDMDAELEALEQQLAKARQIKQGMMQELLTGRVRLINVARIHDWANGEETEEDGIRAEAIRRLGIRRITNPNI